MQFLNHFFIVQSASSPFSPSFGSFARVCVCYSATECSNKDMADPIARQKYTEEAMNSNEELILWKIVRNKTENSRSKVGFDFNCSFFSLVDAQWISSSLFIVAHAMTYYLVCAHRHRQHRKQQQQKWMRITSWWFVTGDVLTQLLCHSSILHSILSKMPLQSSSIVFIRNAICMIAIPCASDCRRRDWIWKQLHTENTFIHTQAESTDTHLIDPIVTFKRALSWRKKGQRKLQNNIYNKWSDLFQLQLARNNSFTLFNVWM